MLYNVAWMSAVLTIGQLALAQNGAPQPPTTPTPPAHRKPLTPGDAAPKLSVGPWLKGKQFDKFESGKVYVVEFWATWCGPCKRAMPDLTALQKKHEGKLVVLGVSIWERFDTEDKRLAALKAFVKNNDAAMGYTVAGDSKEGDMSRDWMFAAKQSSIPTSFVIDQSGKIAWIGNPFSGLDEVVEGVLKGSFDRAAFEAKREKDAEDAYQRDRAKNKALEEIMTLVTSGQHAQAAKQAAAALVGEKDQDRRTTLLMIQFGSLARSDEPAASAFAEELLKGEFKNADISLMRLADRLTEQKELSVKMTEVATRFAARANEVSKGENPLVLDSYSYALSRAGKPKEALAQASAALKLLERTPNPDAALLARVKGRVEEFTKAAK